MRSKNEESDPLHRAVGAFLRAVNHPHAEEATTRVATIWRQDLLKGEGVALHTVPRAVNNGPAPTQDPVAITNIAIHMVCPHHMTVAFGWASLAYIPSQKTGSLGSLGELCTAATARIVLQEQATVDLANALMDTRGLAAIAATARIVAQHPCQRLTHPAAHNSEIKTLVSRGNQQFSAQLEALL